MTIFYRTLDDLKLNYDLLTWMDKILVLSQLKLSIISLLHPKMEIMFSVYWMLLAWNEASLYITMSSEAIRRAEFGSVVRFKFPELANTRD